MSVAINRAFLLKTRTSPTETVDTGEAYFWLDGTSVKYKDDTQAVKTLATGVSSEDVQDIIGAFITSGNNRITAVYNDAGNSFVITLIESNIVHQNLSGAGTNTHAQIDSHIANTSNPHATTAAQVGADPTGSAAAAQAFSIQRANHTGSQLASTISDFSNAVLGLLLTGFTVGANVAIAATDSVLQAFGKIQGQINAITSVLSSLVLGDQFENFEDNTTFTTTAATNQVAASFTTATKQTGKYRIGIEWDWSYSSTGNDSIYSVWVDGVQVSQEFRYELSDANAQLLNNHFSYYATFATIQTHTIELRARAENAGSTVNVSRVRSEIWRATP